PTASRAAMMGALQNVRKWPKRTHAARALRFLSYGKLRPEYRASKGAYGFNITVHPAYASKFQKFFALLKERDGKIQIGAIDSKLSAMKFAPRGGRGIEERSQLKWPFGSACTGIALRIGDCRCST
ncbi:MAG: hypothetical protein WCC80_00785, partial [Pseudolabrys sp.]